MTVVLSNVPLRISRVSLYEENGSSWDWPASGPHIPIRMEGTAPGQTTLHCKPLRGSPCTMLVVFDDGPVSWLRTGVRDGDVYDLTQLRHGAVKP